MAGQVEVLHWWTSGGEARSVTALKGMLQAKGDTWKDFAVAGGGGENAMTVLKARVVSGHAPTAAQIKGPAIQEWGAEGVLANIDALAVSGGWDKLLPPVVASTMKYEGHYVAAPVNVHRVNWMWVNKGIFDKLGLKVPSTWPQLLADADKIQKAGYVAIAHGGQPWQDATLFESVALGVGGADFYRKAFVQRDQATLTGPTMIKVFDTFRQTKKFIDKDAPGRDWNLATGMVINGKAAMQFMGDWAKGEFTAANKKPGTDYICADAPGTANTFTYNIDSFVFFQQGGDEAQKSQLNLAATIMDPKFQELFNLNKGSIPARLGMSQTPFDACAQKSMNDFVATSKKGTLVPSFAHGMALPSSAAGAVTDVISAFFNSTTMTSKEAATKLAAAAKQ
jgi:glucose/mannose transport system substrate-binding protein